VTYLVRLTSGSLPAVEVVASDLSCFAVRSALSQQAVISSAGCSGGGAASVSVGDSITFWLPGSTLAESSVFSVVATHDVETFENWADAGFAMQAALVVSVVVLFVLGFRMGDKV